MRWVEDGVAPERIVATKFNNDSLTDGVAFTRPLCKVCPSCSYSWCAVDAGMLMRSGSTRRRRSTSGAPRTMLRASSAREVLDSRTVDNVSVPVTDTLQWMWTWVPFIVCSD